MLRGNRDLGPNQLILWPRHELTEVMAPTGILGPTALTRDTPRWAFRCSTTRSARSRSGRLQAVERPPIIRIGEKYRDASALLGGGLHRRPYGRAERVLRRSRSGTHPTAQPRPRSSRLSPAHVHGRHTRLGTSGAHPGRPRRTGLRWARSPGLSPPLSRSSPMRCHASLPRRLLSVRFILQGALVQDYNKAVAKTNSDIQTLNSVCAAP